MKKQAFLLHSEISLYSTLAGGFTCLISLIFTLSLAPVRVIGVGTGGGIKLGGGDTV